MYCPFACCYSCCRALIIVCSATINWRTQIIGSRITELVSWWTRLMLHFMALSQPISNMRWRFSFNPVSHPGPCVCSQHLAVSSGSGQADLEKLCQIMEAVPSLKYICLDVANGYSEYFVEFVKTVRGKFPKHTIMVRFICLSVCLSVYLSSCYVCLTIRQPLCLSSVCLCIMQWCSVFGRLATWWQERWWRS